MNSKIEKQEPVAYRIETGYSQPFYMYSNTLPSRGKWDALYTTPQPCQSCAEKQSAIDVWEGRYADLSAKCAELEQDLQTTADALAENEESEKAWEMLDTERVRYLNDVGDVLGQNNTDESLINAAKRVITTIEFQKKAWGADFVRMTRMEAAIERMRIAGGKDEFQKAFDDAKGLL